jgi:hypothetical protein
MDAASEEPSQYSRGDLRCSHAKTPDLAGLLDGLGDNGRSGAVRATAPIGNVRVRFWPRFAVEFFIGHFACWSGFVNSYPRFGSPAIELDGGWLPSASCPVQNEI